MDYNEIKDKIGIKPYFETELGVLYNADCLDVMAKMPDKCVDLVLTDPPYGINMDINLAKKNGKYGYKHYGYTNWDNKTPKNFNEILRISKNQIIWGGNYFTDKLPASMGWIIWDKGQRDFSLADGEMAWTSYKRAMRIFSISRAKAMTDGKVHPTQKSLDIIVKCINWSKTEDLIFDPFLGSGTTAVACEQLGRKWIGVEISEKYCEIAKKRIKYESSQGKFEFTKDREATNKEVQDETLLSGSMGKPRCY